MSDRWTPKPGQFRAVGEGPLGVHYGKPVWTLEAARDRQAVLATHVPRTWVESFIDGAWKRLGPAQASPDPC